MLIACAPLLAQEECDLFNIQELSDAYLNFQVDTIILQPDGSFEVQLSNGTTFTQVRRIRRTAEYDASALTTDAPRLWSSYLEYNASANTDDGSCTTPVVNGCTDPTYTGRGLTTDPAYTEYDASANTDDGSCAPAVVEWLYRPHLHRVRRFGQHRQRSCTTPWSKAARTQPTPSTTLRPTPRRHSCGRRLPTDALTQPRGCGVIRAAALNLTVTPILWWRSATNAGLLRTAHHNLRDGTGISEVLLWHGR